MSKSLDPSSYPESFWTIAEVVDVGNPVVVGFGGKGALKRAQDTRLSWYGFRNALKRNGEPMGARCAGIEVGLNKLDGEKAELVFSSRQEPEKWKELDAAVAGLGRGETHRVIPGAVDEAVRDYMRKAGLASEEESTNPKMGELMGFEEEPKEEPTG